MRRYWRAALKAVGVLFLWSLAHHHIATASAQVGRTEDASYRGLLRNICARSAHPLLARVYHNDAYRHWPPAPSLAGEARFEQPRSVSRGGVQTPNLIGPRMSKEDRTLAGPLLSPTPESNCAVGMVDDMVPVRCDATSYGGDVEIAIVPENSGSFRVVPRAIEAMKQAGFQRLRVVLRHTARSADVAVTIVSAVDLRNRDLNELLRQGQGRCLVWIHAGWSVESVATTSRLFGDAVVWEELSKAKMRVVFIDITEPNEEAYSKLRSVFETPSRVPVAIVHVRHGRAVVKVVVGPIEVTRRGIVDAIRKTSDGKERCRE